MMAENKSLKLRLTQQIDLIKILVGILLFIGVLILNPFKMDTISVKVLAVAVLMIFWWIAEAIPMPVVALLPLFLFPLMGISTIAETAAPYSNEVIFLFHGWVFNRAWD